MSAVYNYSREAPPSSPNQIASPLDCTSSLSHFHTFSPDMQPHIVAPRTSATETLSSGGSLPILTKSVSRRHIHIHERPPRKGHDGVGCVYSTCASIFKSHQHGTTHDLSPALEAIEGALFLCTDEAGTRHAWVRESKLHTVSSIVSSSLASFGPQDSVATSATFTTPSQPGSFIPRPPPAFPIRASESALSVHRSNYVWVPIAAGGEHPTESEYVLTFSDKDGRPSWIKKKSYAAKERLKKREQDARFILGRSDSGWDAADYVPGQSGTALGDDEGEESAVETVDGDGDSDEEEEIEYVVDSDEEEEDNDEDEESVQGMEEVREECAGDDVGCGGRTSSLASRKRSFDELDQIAERQGWIAPNGVCGHGSCANPAKRLCKVQIVRDNLDLQIGVRALGFKLNDAMGDNNVLKGQLGEAERVNRALEDELEKAERAINKLKRQLDKKRRASKGRKVAWWYLPFQLA
ncbi:hypothetical protein BOTBODRAFT_33661 [Botryobasidium botryosum FD-172 SS1]|uniref:Uncharacterized protein n=1 Tax=Botryobasidium botryosum (strain FD-172 SS1) TaxID=930990 RepID=A0A067MCT8_BOTB1|nr:hypothetical protein BOTBODRAFT_33661 [Botryobasidium botryosum FD-172 SS1]